MPLDCPLLRARNDRPVQLHIEVIVAAIPVIREIRARSAIGLLESCHPLTAPARDLVAVQWPSQVD